MHLTREHKWPQKALLFRLHREKTFSLTTSDRSLASVGLVHLMWRERHASKPNGPVVLRSKHQSQDDALDTQTYSFYIWTHRRTPFMYFFSNGKENEFSEWGAQKKTISFHIKLMKIYLIPGFIHKA